MGQLANTAPIAGSRQRPWQNSGAPKSGTSGTLAGYVIPGAYLMDDSNGVFYVNEGTTVSPYWTPVGYDQAPLFGVHTDFRDGAGKAILNTDAAAFIPGSGLRVFGQGVADTDSGLVAQTPGEGGTLGRITTTNEAAHTLAIGMAAGVMQPDAHAQLVVDVELTNVSAITDRALFVGFLGSAGDALDPAVTGATTVATLVQDDLAGLFMDSGFTDADRIYAVHNKSDAAATQDLTADGDTETDLAAAGTYQRFRVEIDVDGNMTAFVDKVQVYATDDALDADEECAPVVYLESNTTSTASADVRRFAAWAYR